VSELNQKKEAIGKEALDILIILNLLTVWARYLIYLKPFFTRVVSSSHRDKKYSGFTNSKSQQIALLKNKKWRPQNNWWKCFLGMKEKLKAIRDKTAAQADAVVVR
jgi:hypothetical protein